MLGQRGDDALAPSPPVAGGGPAEAAPPRSWFADIPPTAVAPWAGPFMFAEAGDSLGAGVTSVAVAVLAALKALDAAGVGPSAVGAACLPQAESASNASNASSEADATRPTPRVGGPDRLREASTPHATPGTWLTDRLPVVLSHLN
jgi:hypothetical protein